MSHRRVTSHVWTRQFPSEMSQTTHMSHVIYICHFTQIRESSPVINVWECVSNMCLYIWLSHVAHINKSRHTYESVTSNIRMSHVAHIHLIGACVKYVFVHIIKSRCTYKCVTSDRWLSHVTRMYESRRTYQYDTYIRCTYTLHI